MRHALILHGKPTKAKYFNPEIPKPHEAHWLPWLKKELAARDIPALTPAFPTPYEPRYEWWKQAFEQYRVDRHTGLVGHSAGAGFIVRWLSENPGVVVEKTVLVAPWHNSEHKYGKDFFNYEIDPEISRRVGQITILNSLDDTPDIQASAELLRSTIPGVNYRELSGFGHFMIGNNMTGPEFPELLEELMSD